jgi:hypothetical protein
MTPSFSKRWDTESDFHPPRRPRRRSAASGGPDPRGDVPIKKVRDIYIPDLRIDTLSMKARNFR